MKSIKQINIENRLYYFFDEMISIANFDPILLDIDKFSLSNDIIIYKIRYITMRSIDNGNLHLKFNNLSGYLKKIMEINTWLLLLQTRTKKYKKVHRTLTYS